MEQTAETQLFQFASFLSGWIYFGCWSLTYYPQIYKNFKRKSVAGLSIDYLAYSTLGHLYYLLYNITIMLNKAIRTEIYEYTNAIPQIKINDVVFSIHAAFLCVLMCYQALLYGSDLKISKICIASLCIGFLFVFALGYAAENNLYQMNWGKWTLILGKLKIVSASIKYIPQIYLIFSSKNSNGLSFGSIAFDFSGGFFSILQMLMEAIALNDFKEISNTLKLKQLSPKLSLGMISIIANSILYYQYRTYFKTNEKNMDDKLNEPVTIDNLLVQNKAEYLKTEDIIAERKIDNHQEQKKEELKKIKEV
mmetsp:Transcript_2382/g.3464  ORF Transcript_2382/g.3464 Transcript_2382/m.3464 type:complete len:308 (-) Transcript_2382:2970-3893(-)